MSAPGTPAENASAPRPQARPAETGREPSGKPLTIGAVCKSLAPEFPELSISKIRYLEDQKLISPRRTPGGYRLYSQQEVARLRTILRMQRDEFLPLRVIRQELAAGREQEPTLPATARVDGQRASRSSVSVSEGGGALYSLQEVAEEAQVQAKLIEELREYGVIAGEVRAGTTYFDDTEREIIRAVAELSRYGVGGRNLRVFRSSADREASLLQQILAPSLRSRNPERRKQALDTLENLAAVTTRLKHLLLVADLRRIVR